MKSSIVFGLSFFSVVAFTSAQQQQSQQYQVGALGPGFAPNSVGASLLQNTTPKPAVYPPAQVHYVNIGEELAGDYKFGYDTGKNGGGQSFREESRLPDGTVKGAYGYIDAEGKQRIVKYTAGIEGFKVESDEEAPGSASAANPAPRSAPVRTYSPPPQQSRPVVTVAPQPEYRALQRTYTPTSPQQTHSQPTIVRTYTPVNGQPTTSIVTAGQPVPASAAITFRIGGNPAQAYAQSGGLQLTAPPQAAPQVTYQQPQVTASLASPSPLPNYQSQVVSPSQYARSTSAVENPNAQALAALIQRQQALQASLAAANAARISSASPNQHLASIPRNQNYGSSQQLFNTQTLQAEQEATTWGPPVINKELLSYNIGIQG